MKKVNVTMVLVHYKCWDYLEKNLLTVQNQTVSINQIIIINNGSVVDLEHKLLALSHLPIKLINNKCNIGFGAACNQAANFIDNDSLVLFCNPDVEIPHDGIETLYQTYQKSNSKILGCNQSKANGKLQKVCGHFPSLKSFAPIVGKLLTNSKSTERDAKTQVKNVDWITGAVILVAVKDFRKLGGFDEDFFMFMEDVDLCLRARMFGMEIGTTSKTTWIHHHGKSSIHDVKDRINSKTESIKSKHKYIQKNMPKLTTLAHILAFLKYAPELMVALILGLLIPAKEVKIKQKVAINLLSTASKTLFSPLMRINNG